MHLDEAVSTAYRAIIAYCDLSAAQAPTCSLLDEHERVVALVDLNGRVLRTGPLNAALTEPDTPPFSRTGSAEADVQHRSAERE